MTVYYITLFLIVVFGFLAQNYDYVINGELSVGKVRHTNMSKRFFVLLSLVLILVAGLRYRVGTDYPAYYKGFLSYAEDFWNSLKGFDEPGYRFMCRILAIFTSEPAVSIFFASLITIGISLIVIYRHTDKLLLAILFFVFLGCWHNSFNAVRQCMAASIAFCGFQYARDKKLAKYILIIFLAFLFHRSAIIMLPLYFLINIDIKFKNILFLIAATVVVLLSYESIMPMIGTLTDQVYSETNTYIWGSVNVLRIMVACAPAIMFLILRWGKVNSQEEKQYINILVFHAVLMVMSSQSAYLARSGLYSSFYCAIAIPEMLKKISKPNRKFVTGFMLLMYFAFWFYEISSSSTLSDFKWIFNYV